MSEDSMIATNRMAIVLLPRVTPSIRSPTVTRNLQPIKRFAGHACLWHHSLVLHRRCKKMRKLMQGVGFEPTKALPPELKSGAVGRAWQPLRAV